MDGKTLKKSGARLWYVLCKDKEPYARDFGEYANLKPTSAEYLKEKAHTRHKNDSEVPEDQSVLSPLAILKAFRSCSSFSNVGGSFVSLAESFTKMMYRTAFDPQCGQEPSFEIG